jgi:hypothetical protein
VLRVLQDTANRYLDLVSIYRGTLLSLFIIKLSAPKILAFTHLPDLGNFTAVDLVLGLKVGLMEDNASYVCRV